MIVAKVVINKKVIPSISKPAIFFFFRKGKKFEHAQFMFLSVALPEAGLLNIFVGLG
jgi:hypothetical protein